MRAPEFWAKPGLAPALLSPLSALYAAGGKLRQALAAPVKMEIPVLCVGNLVMGGAGKTPVALAVAEMLRTMGRNPFFLSRGYGGSLSGPLRVDAEKHHAEEVGDEPLLLARRHPTIISRDRAAGARLAAKQGADAIVMDDGFQNPALFKTLSLLVVDAEYGFGNGKIFPAGPLREKPEAGMARAQAVVLVGSGESPVIHPRILRARLVPEAEEWRGKPIAAFAGIGRPEKFRRSLAECGCELSFFTAFPDHHPYIESELEALHAQAGGLPLVTTEKDHVRLPAHWRERIGMISARLEMADASAWRALLSEAFAHA